MKKGIYLLLSVLVMAACSSPKYSVDTYSPEKTDYSQYKTFGYTDMSSGLSEDMTRLLSVLLQSQGAINNEMERRGFTLAPKNTTPDLIINIGTLVETKKDVDVTGVAVYPQRDMLYWGAVDYDLRYDAEVYQSSMNVKEYKEGSLLVDVVDTKKKVLLWHGVVSKPLEQNGAQSDENPVNKAVSILFKKFPVEPKGSK